MKTTSAGRSAPSVDSNFRYSTLYFWWWSVPPRDPTDAEIELYLARRSGPLPMTPPVPFWDVPGLFVLGLFFVALALGVSHWRNRAKATAAGVAGVVPQGDGWVTPTSEAATQTSFEPDYPLMELSTSGSTDDWSVVHHLVPTGPDFSGPPQVGVHLAQLGTLPWGYIFAGGAFVAGVLHGWDLLRPRRRPRRAYKVVLNFIYFSFYVLSGGLVAVGGCTSRGSLSESWVPPLFY